MTTKQGEEDWEWRTEQKGKGLTDMDNSLAIVGGSVVQGLKDNGKIQ